MPPNSPQQPPCALVASLAYASLAPSRPFGANAPAAERQKRWADAPDRAKPTRSSEGARTRSGPSRLKKAPAQANKGLDKFSPGIMEPARRRSWMGTTRGSIAGVHLSDERWATETIGAACTTLGRS
jgi:hypothetical protein